MKLIKYPDPSQWDQLISRPAQNMSGLEESVQQVMADVKCYGDEALRKFTQKFDGVDITSPAVSPEEIEDARQKVDEQLQEAIQLAKANIEKFHRSQYKEEPVVETMQGVKCWRRQVPIERVGLYIPGGSAPLFSTVLMLGVPAQIAGCEEVILCTPPQKNGQVDPAVLYTADLMGITKIYKAGGAQAIAAMAYGTETIQAVCKIFGPGNAFVTKAKELIQRDGIAIDMPAGPSELLVIADDTSDPSFVAADLLSQAEHGADSQVVLLTDSERLIYQVKEELEQQISVLPRKETAQQALDNSFFLLMDSLSVCMNFSNRYAPEHLILVCEEHDKFIPKIKNAGSVFIGNYSCESVGDYASGTNHTLPTGGYARSSSGVSLDSFMKKITFQELTPQGVQNVGPAVEQMAQAEGLQAHKNAVSLRLNSTNRPKK